MDAVKYLKEAKRMCSKHESCEGCPIENYSCNFRKIENPEELITIVEKWSKEHPLKTRQSEFLKMFPNANTMHKVIYICPQCVDKKFECPRKLCAECRENYWLAEVE